MATSHPKFQLEPKCKTLYCQLNLNWLCYIEDSKLPKTAGDEPHLISIHSALARCSYT